MFVRDKTGYSVFCLWDKNLVESGTQEKKASQRQRLHAPGSQKRCPARLRRRQWCKEKRLHPGFPHPGRYGASAVPLSFTGCHLVVGRLRQARCRAQFAPAKALRQDVSSQRTRASGELCGTMVTFLCHPEVMGGNSTRERECSCVHMEEQNFAPGRRLFAG